MNMDKPWSQLFWMSSKVKPVCLIWYSMQTQVFAQIYFKLSALLSKIDISLLDMIECMTLILALITLQSLLYVV